jgi:hypothetical protein
VLQKCPSKENGLIDEKQMIKFRQDVRKIPRDFGKVRNLGLHTCLPISRDYDNRLHWPKGLTNKTHFHKLPF